MDLLRSARALLAVLGVVSACSDAWADEPFVDPKRWSSPSGEWVLDMEPSDPEGGGPAQYSLERNGEPVWEGPHPFTLREAVVADTGIAVGYAYDNGYMGFNGQLVCMTIGADGQLLSADSRDRTPIFFVTPNPPSEPRGWGVFELDGAGVAAVCLGNLDEVVTWAMFSTRTGEHLGDFEVPGPTDTRAIGFRKCIAASPVPGTSLVLVHWYTYEGDNAVFSLVDPTARREVWHRDIPGEYADLRDDWSWWELVERGVAQTAVSDAGFSVTSFASGMRTHYQILEDGGGAWIVGATGEERSVPTERIGGPLQWAGESLTAERVGEVVFQASPPTSPIRDVLEFDIDDAGRIGWVRRPEAAGGRYDFVLIDREGGLVSSHALDLPDVEQGVVPKATWLGGERWLLTRTWYPGAGESAGAAWTLNASSGAISPAIDREMRGIEVACRTPDGWMVVEGRYGEHVAWRQRTGVDGQHLGPLERVEFPGGRSASEFCVLADGTVATLSAVPAMVWIGVGDEAREIPLHGLIGGRGIYAASIRPTPNGLAVLETSRWQAVHLLGLDGENLGRIDVRGPDGEEFRLYENWRFDPDGNLWASDHHRLYRFDGEVVAQTLGPNPGDGIGEPIAVALDSSDQFYVLERGTGAVHVFGSDGERRDTWTPPPGAVSRQDALAWIKVRRDGSVHFRTNWDDGSHAFDASGRFLGQQEAGGYVPPREEQWRTVGGGSEVWQFKSDALRLTTDGQKEVFSFSRRPSGAWLRQIGRIAAGPDDSLAWISEEENPADWSGATRAWLCVVEADGSSRMEMEIPVPSGLDTFHYDGNRVIIDERGLKIVTIDTRTGRVGVWDRDLPDTSYAMLVGVASDGAWLTWNVGERRVERWRVGVPSPTAR